MKRRGFISIIAGAGGSFLLPPAVLRQIKEIRSGIADPRILAPDQPALILSAHKSFEGYIIHLGDPAAEPDYPTVEEYIESRGFNPYCDKSMENYLIETWFVGDESRRKVREAIKGIRDTFGEPIEGHDRDCWEEWEYALSECSMAKAFRYLEVLPLSDGYTAGDISMGCLSFRGTLHQYDLCGAGWSQRDR